ncbi:MAG TPA: O-antigen ligase family protein [Gemmatimonadales bacterium]|nr:O-antigen ligase family protein [Gemmatimonadales bacterium]
MTATWPLRAAEPAQVRLGAVARPVDGLLYLSLTLLLLSTLQAGPVSDVIKLLWLASVAVLTALNAGAAFGVYVASVALFAVLHFSGWGSVFERPDNYALLIVLGGLTARTLARQRAGPWHRTTVWIGAFVAYTLVQGIALGVMDRTAFAWFMRMFGLPMMMFVLLSRYGFEAVEVRALVRALFVVGVYTALVAIVERFGWYDRIVPAWIGDPKLNWFMVTSGRSGGLLMQPEWNGLALSLIYCLAILSGRLLSPAERGVALVVGALCLVGIFFSYTRAAWLATTIASLVLLLRPSGNRAATHVKRAAVVAAALMFGIGLALARGSTAQSRIGDSNEVYFRLNLWEAGLHMAAERPLLGAGFATFSENVADYQQDMTIGPNMDIRSTPVHNTLLAVQVELGVVGLVLYVGVLVGMFRRARQSVARQWGREGMVWVAVFAGVYFLQAQFANAHEPTTNQIFYGFMGVLAGL